MLSPDWRLLRLYDCGPHAKRVLEVIRRHALPQRVLLGAYLEAEQSNPHCPWGAWYPVDLLEHNRQRNDAEIQRLIELAADYPDIVIAGAVGNEAAVDWTDHPVTLERIAELLSKAKQSLRVPVTICDNYVPWLQGLGALADNVDFIGIHTYPVWEGKGIEESLQYTQANYEAVARQFPHKQVVITEAGWPSAANGRGIQPHCASEELQEQYIDALLRWTAQAGIPCFVFEAFDEPWKGSDDGCEPEKHWGIYTETRRPKRFISSHCSQYACSE